jgi:hypothetical protein
MQGSICYQHFRMSLLIEEKRCKSICFKRSWKDRTWTHKVRPCLTTRLKIYLAHELFILYPLRGNAGKYLLPTFPYVTINWGETLQKHLLQTILKGSNMNNTQSQASSHNREAVEYILAHELFILYPKGVMQGSICYQHFLMSLLIEEKRCKSIWFKRSWRDRTWITHKVRPRLTTAKRLNIWHMKTTWCLCTNA